MSKPTIDEQISLRFLEVLSDHVGPGKRFKFKKAFADTIGLRQQSLVKIENGSAVQFRHLVIVHKLFGVNLNWLVAGTGEKYHAKSNGSMSLEQRVAHLEKLSKVSGKKQV